MLERLLPISIRRSEPRAASEPIDGAHNGNGSAPVALSPGRSPRSDRFRLIQSHEGLAGSPSDTSRASSPGAIEESGRASRLAEAEDDEDTDVFDDDLEDERRPVIEAPALVTPTALTSPGSPWPFTSDHPGIFASLRRTRTGTLTQISSPEMVASEPVFTPADLPHEILLQILRVIGATADLKSAILVCKSWCQCGVELLWHKPVFHTHMAMINSLSILSRPNQTFPYAQFIKRLNFSGLTDEVDDFVLTKLTGCERLERLTLAGSIKVKDDGLIMLLKATKSLVALDLSECADVTDRSIITAAENCPRLQGLNLSGCKKITNAGIAAIARSAKLLRRVRTGSYTSH